MLNSLFRFDFCGRLKKALLPIFTYVYHKKQFKVNKCTEKNKAQLHLKLNTILINVFCFKEHTWGQRFEENNIQSLERKVLQTLCPVTMTQDIFFTSIFFNPN